MQHLMLPQDWVICRTIEMELLLPRVDDLGGVSDVGEGGGRGAEPGDEPLRADSSKEEWCPPLHCALLLTIAQPCAFDSFTSKSFLLSQNFRNFLCIIF